MVPQKYVGWNQIWRYQCTFTIQRDPEKNQNRQRPIEKGVCRDIEQLAEQHDSFHSDSFPGRMLSEVRNDKSKGNLT